MATTGTGRISACGSFTYKWSREEYTPRMALLSGRAYDTANCECAVVCAYLLKRPPRWLADGSESIFVDLDEETEEGELVSVLFADSHGGVPVPALASRPKWSKSAASGGLVLPRKKLKSEVTPHANCWSTVRAVTSWTIEA